MVEGPIRAQNDGGAPDGGIPTAAHKEMVNTRLKYFLT